MEHFQDEASRTFDAEFSRLSSLVQERIQMEWRFHDREDFKVPGFHLLDAAVEFGKVLRAVYRHHLQEALQEEAVWMAAVFDSHGWGQDAFSLLLDSWNIAILGTIPSPECNHLAKPLQSLRAELPALFAAARERNQRKNQTSSSILLDPLLQGDLPEARKSLASLAELYGSPERVIIEGILRAMAEVGELWEQNRIEIYQEHLATETIRNLLAGLTAQFHSPRPETGKTALVSCSPGDSHALIPLALCTYLEIRGWKAKNLGGSLPAEQIARAARALAPDALFLTFTTLSRLDDVLETKERVQAEGISCRIIVGGRGAQAARSLLGKNQILVAADFEEGFQLAMGVNVHA